MLPITQFSGTAVVIHCPELQAGERIAMRHIRKQWETANQAEFILFHTGWSRYWGQPEYFGDYPYITHQVADWLLKTGKKGIGLDTIGLDQVGDGVVFFCALPLKQADADGAPVRAVAFWAD